MPGTTNDTSVLSKDIKKFPEVEQLAENGDSSHTDDKTVEEQKAEGGDNRETLISEAASLLAQGKRHLFVKDYPSAVSTLGDTCGKFSDLYGELAYECADAYFNYGCALLELAREETGVLDVDNKDKDTDESEEGVEDESGANDVKNEGNADTADEKAGECSTEDKTEAGKSSEEKDKSEEDDEEENEEGEDVDNLQLAWEIFELAKRSFLQRNDELKLAETYLKLGEVALESENYDGAISDIQQCLDLQKKNLPPVSREIAETHFQLGVACSLSNQFDNAIKHFTSAGELLESRIQNLSKMTEPEPEKAKNPFYSISNEIEEIKALLPEIKEKIIDMEEFKKETMKVVEATIGIGFSKGSADGAGSSSANGASTASKGPASDISHLIRKKRKPEDTSESEPKKQHLESNSK